MSQDKRDKNRSDQSGKPAPGGTDPASAKDTEPKTQANTTGQKGQTQDQERSQGSTAGADSQKNAEKSTAESSTKPSGGTTDEAGGPSAERPERGASAAGGGSRSATSNAGKTSSGASSTPGTSDSSSPAPAAKSSSGSSGSAQPSRGADQRSTGQARAPGATGSGSKSSASVAATRPSAGSTRPSSGTPQQSVKPSTGKAGAGGSGTPKPAKSGGDGRRRRRLVVVIAVLALIIALLALAASGVLWYRGQQRLASLDNHVASVQSGLQNRLKQQVMPRLGKLNNQVQQLTKRSQRLSQSLSQQAQQLSQFKQSLAHVQSQNAQLSNQLGGNHELFVEQRIALMLEAANQRLQIEHDPNGALRALTLANQAIVQAGDPQLHPVRAKITDEIATLKALPNPDLEGLSLKLSNLIGQIPKLPLASNVPSNYQPKAASNGNAAGKKSGKAQAGQSGAEFAGITLARKWHNFLNSIGSALSQMVTIRRANGTEEAPALMAPKQAFFLVQNLQLQLRTARLALLDGNTQTYQSSVNEAHGWVKRYFDTSDSQVSAALNELSKLSKVKLEAQTPDISESLNTLRQIMAKNRSQPVGNAAGGQSSGQNSSHSPGQNSGQDAGSS